MKSSSQEHNVSCDFKPNSKIFFRVNSSNFKPTTQLTSKTKFQYEKEAFRTIRGLQNSISKYQAKQNTLKTLVPFIQSLQALQLKFFEKNLVSPCFKHFIYREKFIFHLCDQPKQRHASFINLILKTLLGKILNNYCKGKILDKLG